MPHEEILQGIPESYLKRGINGVRQWLSRRPHHGREVELDTPISLNDLRPYLPRETTKQTVRRWVTQGRESKLGKNVKLEAWTELGTYYTTLENYRRFQLRLDPSRVISLSGSNYLIWCANCDEFLKFNLPTGEGNLKNQVMRTTGWHKHGGFGVWFCNKCEEST